MHDFKKWKIAVAFSNQLIISKQIYVCKKKITQSTPISPLKIALSIHHSQFGVFSTTISCQYACAWLTLALSAAMQGSFWCTLHCCSVFELSSKIQQYGLFYPLTFTTT